MLCEDFSRTEWSLKSLNEHYMTQLWFDSRTSGADVNRNTWRSCSEADRLRTVNIFRCGEEGFQQMNSSCTCGTEGKWHCLEFRGDKGNKNYFILLIQCNFVRLLKSNSCALLALSSVFLNDSSVVSQVLLNMKWGHLSGCEVRAEWICISLFFS